MNHEDRRGINCKTNLICFQQQLTEFGSHTQYCCWDQGFHSDKQAIGLKQYFPSTLRLVGIHSSNWKELQAKGVMVLYPPLPGKRKARQIVKVIICEPIRGPLSLAMRGMKRKSKIKLAIKICQASKAKWKAPGREFAQKSCANWGQIDAEASLARVRPGGDGKGDGGCMASESGSLRKQWSANGECSFGGVAWAVLDALNWQANANEIKAEFHTHTHRDSHTHTPTEAHSRVCPTVRGSAQTACKTILCIPHVGKLVAGAGRLVKWLLVGVATLSMLPRQADGRGRAICMWSQPVASPYGAHCSLHSHLPLATCHFDTLRQLRLGATPPFCYRTAPHRTAPPPLASLDCLEHFSSGSICVLFICCCCTKIDFGSDPQSACSSYTL